METLPQDLIISIFIQLDRFSVGQVCRLNKRIESICRSDRLWKQLVQDETDVPWFMTIETTVAEGSTTWKDSYRDLSKIQLYYN